MAVLAFAGAGYLIGAGLTYGTAYMAIGSAIGWAVGSYVGSMLFATKEKHEGPRMEDLKVQTSTYGAPIPEVFGAFRVSGNLIWATELKEKRHNKSSRDGKGGGGETEYTTYTYSVSFAVGLCEGEILGIGRIWLDTKLYIDNRSDVWKSASTSDLSMKNLQITITNRKVYTVYPGSETQTADPTMEAELGVGEVPAYRGLCYIVFDDLELKKYGNRIPNVSVEVFAHGSNLNEKFETSVSTSNISGINITDTGDMVLCNTSTKKFIRYDKITGAETLSFDYPIYNDEDYAGSDHSLGGWTIYNGNLITIWNTNNSSKPIEVLYHTGISSAVTSSKNIQEKYTPWQSSPTSINITAITVYDAELIVAESSRDEIVKFTSFDTLEYAYGFTPTFPTGSTNLAPNSIDINPSTENMWLDYAGDKICEYSGISSSLLTTESSWGSYSSIGGFGYYDNEWLVAFKSNDIVKMYSSDWSEKLVEYTKYEAASYPSVGTVVSSLSQSAGILPAEINTSLVNDLYLIGYARTNVMSARNAIEPLQKMFLFDIAEVDKVLKFVKRDSISAVTIPATQLMAKTFGNDEKLDIVESTFINEVEFPVEITVKFLHFGRNYTQSAQNYKIYFSDTKNKIDVNLPIVMDATTALQTAQKLLLSRRSANVRYVLSSYAKNIFLAPADPIIVDSKRSRITQMSISGGLLKIQSESEQDASSYTSSLTTSSGDFELELPSTVSPTSLVFLDTPVFYEIDSNAGFYVAAYGLASAWPGCVVYYSSDGGGTWNQIQTITSDASAGVTTTKLQAGGTAVIDGENTLTVRMYSGTLSSITQAAMLNGSNGAAVGAHGRWEIIQFQNATLNADGTYTIDTLLRGRKGTAWAIETHQTGDLFVLLDSNIARIPLGSSEINQEETYRAVSFGQSIHDVSDISFTNTAIGLKCYSPCHLNGLRNSSNDINITWTRRDRVYGESEWADFSVATKNAEDSELYDIEFFDQDTIVRTVSDLTDPQYTYTAAMQIADFGAVVEYVVIKVYQKSTVVGRGYPATATVGATNTKRTITPGDSKLLLTSDSVSTTTRQSVSPNDSKISLVAYNCELGKLSLQNSKITLTSDSVASWLTDWQYRKKFTIDSSKIDSSLSDFPVALLLSTSAGTNDEDLTAIFTEIADSDRKKIAVTTSDGTTQCYVEIEKWDSTNKKAALHVKVPTISSSANTELYLYYDSGHADNTTYVGNTGDSVVQNVWDNNFKAVYHMAQDPSNGSGAIKDSTSNGNNGTSAGTMTSTDLVDGQSGKAIEFDGIDDYINCGSDSSIDNITTFSIEAVFNMNGWGESSWGRIIQKANVNNDGFSIFVDGDSGQELLSILAPWTTANGKWSTPASSFSLSTWYHVAICYNSSSTANDAIIYKNGTSLSITENSTPAGSFANDSANDMWIGARNNSGSDREFDGKICEIRISAIIRSSSWIKATYYTLFDNLGEWG